MSRLIAQSLPAATRDVESFAYEFRALPEGWAALAGLVVLVALTAAVIFMYRHEARRGASMRLRLGLAAIRVAVLLALASIWLEPVRVRYLHRWIDSYTVLLVDTSSSMDLTDTYRDAEASERLRRALRTDEPKPISRSAVAGHLLSDDGAGLLKGLARNNRVKLYTFDAEPQLAATIRASREPAPEPAKDPGEGGSPIAATQAPRTFAANGASTNINRAVRQSVESLGAAPIAGVILLTDGRVTEGEPVESVGRYARDRRLPIYAVGIGDPSEPRNLRVSEVAGPDNVLSADPFAITARISAQGLGGSTVAVELREQLVDKPGDGKIVERRDVLLSAEGVSEPVSFSHQQSRVGRWNYSVVAELLPDESVADDNQRSITVSVMDARIRALVVAGAPSWDYRFLYRLLERDKTIDVSCWLQSADQRAVRDGNTIIDHLPSTAEELFQYDVILLVDPDPEELDAQWCRLLDTFVTEHGGGLLYSAARLNTPNFMRDHRLNALHTLLPVTLDPDADLMLNEIGYYQQHPSPLHLEETAAGHPILRFLDDAVANRLAWEGLGEVYWHYPVLRAKPVATVLFRHGDSRMRNSFGPHTLGAVQIVGSGRVGFLAMDGTWRWRAKGIELYDRFWIQMVRYLVEGKVLGGTKRANLHVEADQYALGEAVKVTARLLDHRFEPLDRDRVSASWTIDEDRREFDLVARKDNPGWFEGQFVPDRVGNFRVSVAPPVPPGGQPVRAEREVRVARPNLEMIAPQMARSDLVSLASLSHGGRYLDVDEVSTLPDLIPDMHEEMIIRSRPTNIWDNSVVLSILVALLCVEWGVRKWKQLL